jgi:AmmeMemoRadiSam system protein A
MNPERGRLLLDLARRAIAEAFGGPPVVRPVHDGWLDEPTALFVSLHRGGELRGCIGSLEAHRPLFEEVVAKAKAAAFHDSRMVPVQAGELPDLAIELTLLGPLEPIAAGSEEELLSQLRPGVDGLLLESREGGAVFIPSVWRQLPEPRAFLEALLRKAQLGRWPRDIRAFRFLADEVSSAPVEV